MNLVFVHTLLAVASSVKIYRVKQPCALSILHLFAPALAGKRETILIQVSAAREGPALILQTVRFEI